MLVRCGLVLALLTTVGAGCVVHLAPPPVPAKVVPQVDVLPDPPGDGEGQLIIDATNGPADVQVVVSALTFGSAAGSAATVITRPLCAKTPCAVNLPYGTYNLILQGKNDEGLSGSEAVQVGRSPSVFRQTLGSTRSSPGLLIGGILAITVGATVALTGGIFALSDTSKTTGLVTLGVGAAMTGGGVAMMYAGPTRIQPGSSVQWVPDGSTPATTDPMRKRQVFRFTPNGFIVSFN